MPYRSGLSGLSSEVVVDKDGNVSFSGSADEIFVDPARGDFRLKAGSPAIGMGVPLAEVRTDIDGRPRDPVRPSIGAYEYSGSPTDGPPVVFKPPVIVPPDTPPDEVVPEPVPTEVAVQEVREEAAATQAASFNFGSLGVGTLLALGLGLALLFGGSDEEYEWD
jgi:hypothetical protein